MKLTEDDLSILRKLGILDEIGVRNYYIRNKINKKISEGNKITLSIIEVAKELNMSEDTVHDIYYRKQKRNKEYFYKVKEIE